MPSKVTDRTKMSHMLEGDLERRSISKGTRETTPTQAPNPTSKLRATVEVILGI
jgi:hypothetical protein